MSMMYNPEDLRNFLKEEQEKSNSKASAADQEELKKARSTASRAASNAQVAFEETQKLRFELDGVKADLRKSRIIAIVAIVIAIVCMAMVMGEELTALISNLPA